jgi:hypothetical protein
MLFTGFTIISGLSSYVVYIGVGCVLKSKWDTVLVYGSSS